MGVDFYENTFRCMDVNLEKASFVEGRVKESQ